MSKINKKPVNVPGGSAFIYGRPNLAHPFHKNGGRASSIKLGATAGDVMKDISGGSDISKEDLDKKMGKILNKINHHFRGVPLSYHYYPSESNRIYYRDKEVIQEIVNEMAETPELIPLAYESGNVHLLSACAFFANEEEMDYLRDLGNDDIAVSLLDAGDDPDLHLDGEHELHPLVRELASLYKEYQGEGIVGGS